MHESLGTIAKVVGGLYAGVAAHTLNDIVKDTASKENMRLYSADDGPDEFEQELHHKINATSDPAERSKYYDAIHTHGTFKEFKAKQQHELGKEIGQFIDALVAKAMEKQNDRTSAETQVMRDWKPIKIDPDLPKLKKYEEAYKKLIDDNPELRQAYDLKLRHMEMDYDRTGRPKVLAKLNFYRDVLSNAGNLE